MVKRVDGPPVVNGREPEDYADVPLEALDRLYTLPRIYDPRHPQADKDGKRPCHPNEHKLVREGNKPDTSHSIFDWR